MRMKVGGAPLAALTIAAGLLAGQEPPAAAARDCDCAGFSSRPEAQEYLLPGDPCNLDADSDGVACEMEARRSGSREVSVLVIETGCQPLAIP